MTAACSKAPVSDTPVSGGQPGSRKTGGSENSRLSWQEQKEAQARKRKRQSDLQKTEKRIAQLEEQSSAIDRLLAQEEVYTNSVRCQELAAEKKEISEELEVLYEKWEELAE